MAENSSRIIVDDDWKAQAQREKEQLAEQVDKTPAAAGGPAAAPTFAELLNLIVMQAVAALGLLQGPGGERYPPNLEAAKHFIDMLQVLEDKTRNNLTADEKRLLDQTLYEMRMNFVQISSILSGQGAEPPGQP